MSVSNDIYKKIDVETEACVEAEYSFWKFKPRHKLKPLCYQNAYAKYANELSKANIEGYNLQKQLNQKTITALNDDIASDPVKSIGILIAIVIIIYLIFFLK